MAKKENQANAPKTTKKKASKRSIINAVCIVFLSICVIGSTITFVLVQNILSNSKIMDKIDGLTSDSSSVIYDENGKEIITLSSESGVRENIKYEEMPQVVIDAFLAIEDSRYFKHGGFDLPRFIKSGMANVTQGGIVQGGSTLTMQLVDVKLFPDSQSQNQSTVQKLEQKIVEIFKSMDIESKLDKEKIIELYLNSINFGGPARGIQKGAQYYFGKDAKNLTLTEAAFLAGVINAPGAYNPYTANADVVEGTPQNEIPKTYYEKATQRRNQVLYQMHNHGYITDNEYNLARSSDLALQLNGETNFDTDEFQSFIDVVVEEARTVYKVDPYVTPVKIYTTMNRDAQKLADSILNGDLVDFPDERITTGFNAINNQTGAILAVGGGRSYSGDNRKNHGTDFAHQIGSTAKPIMEYLLAFEELGYSTEHVFEDSPTAYTNDGETLSNADRTFHGDVTFKQAVGHSYNIPAYKTLKAVIEKIGLDGLIEYLNKLGIDQVTKDNFSYAMSIGGGELSLTTLQLSSAFSVMANKGQRAEPYSISKIDFEDNSKEDIVHKEEKVQVVSDEAAYLMSYILRDVVTGGYGTVVGLDGPYPIYAKSGTTDSDKGSAIPEGVAKDKWMVGYTNNFTVSTWVGYEDYDNPNNYFDESKLYLNIEGKITRALLDSLTKGNAQEIERPAGVTSISHVQGVFPYANAAGGNLVTGLIRSKFAKVSNSIEPDPLSDLSGLEVSLKGNALSMAFTPYPKKEALQAAGASKTVTVGSTSFTFVPKFSKNILFGPVQYKYEIYVNGTLVTSSASGSDKVSANINSKKGDEVKVCGFYGYEKNDATSNKVCKTLTSEAQTSYTIGSDFINLFNATTSYEDASAAVQSWAKKMIPDVIVEIQPSTAVDAGKFDPNGSTLNLGSVVKSSETYIVHIGK